MSDYEFKAKVRALFILICIACVVVAAGALWGGWAALLAFGASYGLACLTDEIRSNSPRQ